MLAAHQKKSLAVAVVAASIAATSAVVLIPTAVGASPDAAKVYFGGKAYGSAAGVSSLVQSGKTAAVPLCTSKVGETRADKTAAVHLPGLGSIGAVTNRVGSSGHHSTVSSTSTSYTAKTSLLAGVIKAQALSTQARQSKTGSRYHSTGSTTLVGLTIAGRAMPVHPTRNQTIGLPGLGSVVLNQQSTSSRDGNHTIKVTALHLLLSPGNMAGLPSGSVTIGHTIASLHAPVRHLPYGSAYGTTVQVGSTVKSGRTAPVSLACGGSSGRTVVNKTAGAHLDGALTTAAVSSNARSTDTASATTATTRTRVAGVNLFNGMIRVHAITTRAHVVRHGTHLTRSARGTSILGLTINGTKIAAPRAGTSRTISGLGTLSFDRAIRTSTGVQVYAIRLVLSATRAGLNKGTVITIGSALAGVKA
jgi:hypothetical protein